MRKLIVFLIVLAVVLGVVDRVAVGGAESEIAKQVAAQYKLSTVPTVSISGIPFLTQAAGGRYEEIGVEIGDLTRGGVRLSDVRATLYGVNAPLLDLLQNPAEARITADRVSGSFVVPLSVIEQRAPKGVKLSGDGGDTLKISGRITVRGVTVPVQADMKVETVKNGVRLSPVKVVVAGGIPVPPEATKSLSYTIPVDNLPLGLKVTAVKTVPEGLQITGEASDVPLRA
ncbi:DUF2993 domain-containing protein [Spongiactinospora sp. TRM90649]|uniref:LmeA family phospholipid-binding protein n=1 Tax=Spongiactinospora sp. TRM90649 TaxID=3031114 RepID=UPI0023F69E4F|nr:DUF2993 domain-containing protein [Spongiactinospora sp. TRM90649]MDF5751788.1 DUF2993 domain-containing protein [Spongiactinospora sp. TRM90649]